MQTERQIHQEVSYTQNFRDVADVLSVISSSFYTKLNKLYDSNDTTDGFKSVLDSFFKLSNSINIEDIFKNVAKEYKKVLFIVSCDQGFCGNFNEDLKKYVLKLENINSYDEIIVFGKQFKLPNSHIKLSVRNNIFNTKYLTGLKKEQWNTFDFDNIFHGNIESNPLNIVNLYKKSNTEIHIIYCTLNPQNKKNEVRHEKIFTLEITDGYGSYEESYDKYLTDEKNIIADPSPKDTISKFLDLYNKYKILDIFINSLIAENYKRMNTMNQAKDEIENIMKQLRLQLQKQRQARITGELIELMNAFSNLRKSAARKNITL
jgi:F-type H+-transporting ATPase subunit gamma